MKNIPDDLKAKYFDIICEFGLLTNMGRSPCECATMPCRIPMSIRDSAGVLHSCTAYGVDVVEACERAFDFLNQRGFRFRSDIVRDGLTGFAKAVSGTIAGAIAAGKIEVVANSR